MRGSRGFGSLPYKDGRYQAERISTRSTEALAWSLEKARRSRSRLTTRLFKPEKRAFLEGFVSRLEEELKRREQGDEATAESGFPYVSANPEQFEVVPLRLPARLGRLVGELERRIRRLRRRLMERLHHHYGPKPLGASRAVRAKSALLDTPQAPPDDSAEAAVSVGSGASSTAETD